MMRFELECKSDLDDPWTFDETGEEPIEAGGGKLAHLVAAAFRRIGCEVTAPYVEDVHGWFWQADFAGRKVNCQAVQNETEGYLYFDFLGSSRWKATYFALLAKLDQELKQGSCLRDFQWSASPYGKLIFVGSAPVDPATHPDPDAVLAAPEKYDVPATGFERVFARLLGRKT